MHCGFCIQQSGTTFIEFSLTDSYIVITSAKEVITSNVFIGVTVINSFVRLFVSRIRAVVSAPF